MDLHADRRYDRLPRKGISIPWENVSAKKSVPRNSEYSWERIWITVAAIGVVNRELLKYRIFLLQIFLTKNNSLKNLYALFVYINSQ